MKALIYFTALLTLISLSACGWLSATGDSVEAVGEGAGYAVEETGDAVSRAADETEDAIDNTVD